MLVHHDAIPQHNLRLKTFWPFKLTICKSRLSLRLLVLGAGVWGVIMPPKAKRAAAAAPGPDRVAQAAAEAAAPVDTDHINAEYHKVIKDMCALCNDILYESDTHGTTKIGKPAQPV